MHPSPHRWSLIQCKSLFAGKFQQKIPYLKIPIGERDHVIVYFQGLAGNNKSTRRVKLALKISPGTRWGRGWGCESSPGKPKPQESHVWIVKMNFSPFDSLPPPPLPWTNQPTQFKPLQPWLILPSFYNFTNLQQLPPPNLVFIGD